MVRSLCRRLRASAASSTSTASNPSAHRSVRVRSASSERKGAVMAPAQHLGPEALTRDEAKARAALISDPKYTVALDLTQGEKTFTSETTVTFRCAEAGASTFIDLTAPSVSSIELNGDSVSPVALDGQRIQH